MGLALLAVICLLAGIVAFLVVWACLRGLRWVEPSRARRAALLCTAVSLGVFVAAFVLLLVLLATASDAGGDAALQALRAGVHGLMETLRP